MFYLNKHWQKKSINTSNHFSILPQKICISEHPKPLYFLSASAARRVSLWGEGKRKRFPLQPFAEEINFHNKTEQTYQCFHKRGTKKKAGAYQFSKYVSDLLFLIIPDFVFLWRVLTSENRHFFRKNFCGHKKFCMSDYCDCVCGGYADHGDQDRSGFRRYVLGQGRSNRRSVPA